MIGPSGAGMTKWTNTATAAPTANRWKRILTRKKKRKKNRASWRIVRARHLSPRHPLHPLRLVAAEGEVSPLPRKRRPKKHRPRKKLQQKRRSQLKRRQQRRRQARKKLPKKNRSPRRRVVAGSVAIT